MLKLSGRTRQIAFLSLGGAALVVMLIALVAILVAVDSPTLWLGGCLILLLVIIVGEVVLLLSPEPGAEAYGADEDVQFEL